MAFSLTFGLFLSVTPKQTNFTADGCKKSSKRTEIDCTFHASHLEIMATTGKTESWLTVRSSQIFKNLFWSFWNNSWCKCQKKKMENHSEQFRGIIFDVCSVLVVLVFVQFGFSYLWIQWFSSYCLFIFTILTGFEASILTTFYYSIGVISKNPTCKKSVWQFCKSVYFIKKQKILPNFPHQFSSLFEGKLQSSGLKFL